MRIGSIGTTPLATKHPHFRFYTICGSMTGFAAQCRRRSSAGLRNVDYPAEREHLHASRSRCCARVGETTLQANPPGIDWNYTLTSQPCQSRDSVDGNTCRVATQYRGIPGAHLRPGSSRVGWWMGDGLAMPRAAAAGGHRHFLCHWLVSPHAASAGGHRHFLCHWLVSPHAASAGGDRRFRCLLTCCASCCQHMVFI
jgi:hypothetical protein